MFRAIEGKFPYDHKLDRAKLKKEVMNNQIKINQTYIDHNKFTGATIDFCNRLLIIDPQKRLGTKGMAQVKKHPFLKGFNWAALKNKTMESPLKHVYKI